jgi:hypothetical protein
MSAITVTRDGRLTASPDVVERLKRLCAEDEATLADDRPARSERPCPASRPRARVVEAPPSDDDIERLLGSLMVTVHDEAMKSFALAREHTQSGQLVELRDIHIHQGARLCRAFADLVDARRGRREQRIVVQHVYSGGQAVGLAGSRIEK